MLMSIAYLLTSSDKDHYYEYINNLVLSTVQKMYVYAIYEVFRLSILLYSKVGSGQNNSSKA